MNAVLKIIEDARNAFGASPVIATNAIDSPKIIDAVHLLGNRAEFLRKHERELAQRKKAFEERNKDQWEKLRAVEVALSGLKADEAVTIIGGLIDKVDAHVSALRRKWEMTNSMIEGIIPAAISPDRPEEWVRRALNYILEPDIWAHDSAVEQLDFLKRLRARITSPEGILSVSDEDGILVELDSDQFDQLQRELDEKAAPNAELQRLMSTKPHWEK
jgi:hypothetical protein